MLHSLPASSQSGGTHAEIEAEKIDRRLTEDSFKSRLKRKVEDLEQKLDQAKNGDTDQKDIDLLIAKIKRNKHRLVQVEKHERKIKEQNLHISFVQPQNVQQELIQEGTLASVLVLH